MNQSNFFIITKVKKSGKQYLGILYLKNYIMVKENKQENHEDV